jgi:hypothetical protein
MKLVSYIVINSVNLWALDIDVSEIIFVLTICVHSDDLFKATLDMIHNTKREFELCREELNECSFKDEINSD